MKFLKPNLNTIRGIVLGFVVLVFAQSGAWAGCGDYVVLGGKAALSEQALQHLALKHLEVPGLPVKAPCSGPTCRKQSPMAPAIPLEVAKRVVDQPLWLALLGTAELPPMGSYTFGFESASLSCGYRLDVFHPPRV
ncbi:MAG: hypothetical protein EXS11_10305 [Gemmataceae bacterium]|nr:hypothetical protein [Gemmataceae bacterium]